MKHIKLYENFEPKSDDDFGFEIEPESGHYQDGYELFLKLENRDGVYIYLKEMFGTIDRPFLPRMFLGGKPMWVNDGRIVFEKEIIQNPVNSAHSNNSVTRIKVNTYEFSGLKILLTNTESKLYHTKAILKWYIGMVYDLNIDEVTNHPYQ